jgi:hypothetical protein
MPSQLPVLKYVVLFTYVATRLLGRRPGEARAAGSAVNGYRAGYLPAHPRVLTPVRRVFQGFTQAYLPVPFNHTKLRSSRPFPFGCVHVP